MRKNQAYLLGLDKSTSLTSPSRYIDVPASPSALPGEVNGEAGSQSYQQGEVSEAKCLQSVSDDKLLCEAIRRFAYLSQETQQNFTKEINSLYESISSEPKSEPENELPFVRYKGKVYMVSREDKYYYYLREYGFRKIVAKARKHECEIID
ncbi:hypothetical protein CWATWH0003_5653 [Crocosphaera watsonii WH 0003]|uniref:Uncharacterized protein n=1 Tax=Crocosphaera watsonii WH 0003 TaxID=423471 RepID=G5JE12_CROWT|nr:hypothetical protein CWATWH0003_5653 [Crocosphaera watsonii WH 0003]